MGNTIKKEPMDIFYVETRDTSPIFAINYDYSTIPLSVHTICFSNFGLKGLKKNITFENLLNMIHPNITKIKFRFGYKYPNLEKIISNLPSNIEYIEIPVY